MGPQMFVLMSWSWHPCPTLLHGERGQLPARGEVKFVAGLTDSNLSGHLGDFLPQG